jgi:hypothetical protein
MHLQISKNCNAQAKCDNVTHEQQEASSAQAITKVGMLSPSAVVNCAVPQVLKHLHMWHV